MGMMLAFIHTIASLIVVCWSWEACNPRWVFWAALSNSLLLFYNFLAAWNKIGGNQDSKDHQKKAHMMSIISLIHITYDSEDFVYHAKKMQCKIA